MAALDHGTSLEDIESFELENGLELNEEIFETMEESLIVKADVMDEEIIFELVIFDSQDLDNSRKSDFKGSKILLWISVNDRIFRLYLPIKHIFQLFFSNSDYIVKYIFIDY